MAQLTDLCEIWRMVGAGYDQGKTMRAVYTRVPCLRVPVSSFDKVASALSASTRSTAPSEFFRSEARQSTDVFLLPTWILVLGDDEIRQGRRIDINGTAVAYRYTVSGVRDHDSFGYQHTRGAYCVSLQ